MVAPTPLTCLLSFTIIHILVALPQHQKHQLLNAYLFYYYTNKIDKHSLCTLLIYSPPSFPQQYTSYTMPNNYKTSYQNKFRSLLYTISVFNGIVFFANAELFLQKFIYKCLYQAVAIFYYILNRKFQYYINIYKSTYIKYFFITILKFYSHFNIY